MPVEVTDEYIRIRVRMPGDFTDGSFKTVWLDKSKGINSVQGKLRKPPEGQAGSMVVQSLLFVKEKWTREDAIKWAKEHDYTPKNFEPDITEVDFEYIEKTFEEWDGKSESKSGESDSKSDGPSILEVEHKAYVGELKEVDEKERTITAFISTESLDRQGDIMRASGAQLAAYKKNPVVLWAHNYTTPPIGKNLWIKKVKDKPGLIAKTQFADTEFADEIFRLYQGKFLNAWSVGFLPLESKALENENGGSGRDIAKWELLEYSAVPVPANPEALQLAVQKGIIGETLAKELGVETEEWVEESEDNSITLTIEPPKGKQVNVEIHELEREEEEMDIPEPKQPKLTGEEIAAWKKQIEQAVIAGVQKWWDYALGKVTQKEGDNQDGGERNITRRRRRS